MSSLSHLFGRWEKRQAQSGKPDARSHVRKAFVFLTLALVMLTPPGENKMGKPSARGGKRTPFRFAGVLAALICMVVVVLSVPPVAQAQATSTSVFFTNFNTGAPAEFSGIKTTESVQGYAGLGTGSNFFGGRFLRNTTGSNIFGGGPPPSKTTLTLTGLPAHSSISLGFLLGIVDSWDGMHPTFGPDVFNVKVDGLLIFSEAFDNSGSGAQTYVPPSGVELARAVPLGFDPQVPSHRDSAYDMGLDPTFNNIPHSSSTLTIEWYASGAGWQGGGDESWAIDNVEVILGVAGADLSITKTDSPDPVAVGSDLTYTIEVTNNGPSDATGVSAIDTLPLGVSFEPDFSDPGCVQSGDEVECFLGDLSSGETATFTIVVTLHEFTAPTITNSITVAGNESDPEPDNNTATEKTSVDSSPPTITITTPSNGAVYNLNEIIIADYSCADELGGSGLDTCEGNVLNGLPIDTFSSGMKEFTVRASDSAGNMHVLMHGYRVVSCPDGSAPDTDGDALLDCWETNGIDFNGDGTFDLQLYDVNGDGTIQNSEDADPNHKDIYLEIDWMDQHRPNVTALNNVINAFANAPVPNPDGTQGIRLHIQSSEQALAHNNNLAFEPCTGPAGAGTPDFDNTKLASFGTPAERASANSVNILNAKRFASHYALFVHSLLGLGGTSGCAELPGNDFVVSLGSWPNHGGVIDHQAGTLMHEFGHNVNLRHGGLDNNNCKPNYLSVMSYSRQIDNNPINGRPLDYSRAALPTLNEVNLSEPAGISGPAGDQTAYGPPPVLVAASNAAIDWNRDGDAADLNVSANINNHGGGCGGSGTNLQGHDDWANVLYDFRNSVDFADGIHLTAPESDEIMLDEAVEMSPDSDEDGVVNVLDNCPFHENPAQEDSDGDGIGNACDTDALVSIDDCVTVVGIAQSYDPTDTRGGLFLFGVYSFDVTYMNNSGCGTISEPHVQVTALTGGAAEVIGIGKVGDPPVPVAPPLVDPDNPALADGKLDPGEVVTVHYKVGLVAGGSFNFTIHGTGMVEDGI